MKNFKFHDADDGQLQRCQITDKEDLEEVIDLGFQPLGDSLLTMEELKEDSANCIKSLDISFLLVSSFHLVHTSNIGEAPKLDVTLLEVIQVSFIAFALA